MVDTVLYFRVGARTGLSSAAFPTRPVRSGARSRRVQMRDHGLVEVLDASARFVGEATRAPGSVVLCAMEGSRPLLVEVQALVCRSELVPPRRVVSGLDRNRVALVLAVLGRHAGIGLGAADVFVNVVGGVRVDDPGADLAVALAVASAVRRSELRVSGWPPAACFGELGLTGELRTVAHGDRRLAEAQKFGLTPVVEPETHATLRSAFAAALGARSGRQRSRRDHAHATARRGVRIAAR